MQSIVVMLIPANGKRIAARAEVNTDQVIPGRVMMPAFLEGRIEPPSPEDQAVLKAAKDIEIIFAGTEMRYEAILDTDTWEFRAIDTSERGA